MNISLLGVQAGARTGQKMHDKEVPLPCIIRCSLACLFDVPLSAGEHLAYLERKRQMWSWGGCDRLRHWQGVQTRVQWLEGEEN